MKRIVFRAYYDYEKEEKFLNEMSAKGWALTHYSWCKYVFTEAPKGEYIYRLELLKNPANHPDSQDYLKFMTDSGVEVIATYNRWVYFRKKASNGEFKIYSDLESCIEHYKRVRAFFSTIFFLNLFVGWMNFSLGQDAATKGSFPINTLFALISFTVGALLLGIQVLPLTQKINTLEKEHKIRE